MKKVAFSNLTGMKEKINKDQALAEFEQWLESRRFPDATRAELTKDEDILIEGIQKGYVRFEPDPESGRTAPVYELLEPIGKTDNLIKEVRFKGRIKTKDVDSAAQSQRTDTGRGMAIVARITDLQNTALVKELEASDFAMLDKIAQYFL